MTVDVAAEPWTGRSDGDGDDVLRWHHVTTPLTGADAPRDAAFVGFRSDEGVRRNQGRPGAAGGPVALRSALASVALPAPLRAVDAGDVVVGDGDLEDGQRRLGEAVTALLDAGGPVAVLGGGHEVAYGTYLGLAGSRAVRGGARLGVLNLDAHFDLRDAPRPSSGTPFLQMARDEERQGRRLDYRVLGISRLSNTERLFRTADRLGVHYLEDTDCGLLSLARVEAFAGAFLDACDLVHLSIDLDVLPAAAAPGVSAPAAYGVPMEVVERVVTAVAASGKLAVVDVAELNPDLDIDARTARAGARLVHRALTGTPEARGRRG
ncbi:formimidoylglutamase [Streptomyces sp. NBC_01525]|uniref:Formimidoylglutamase n=1 Tax=Streptomyces benahoarensis TaxID=2595054 RepID=A0A553ZPG0_9ACTN|nr:formimidoylglutamase [Streptomyces benahoarensis]TSB22704.1 formimidoylglutamase [Streptomyces benahoarensis]TSB43347.1 formimidoylglutamase [Streptomyces benahoarensis]